MGFRTGAYAKIWEIKPISNAMTKLRISISRKKRGEDEYVQDFSGYVVCIGTAAADKASRLSVGDTIKLGDVDVSNTYDKEKKVTYTDYKIFAFDVSNRPANSAGDGAPEQAEGGEPEAPESDERLPF